MVTREAVEIVPPRSGEPLPFVGPPTKLTSVLEVRNPGERYVVVREVGLSDHSRTLTPERQRHACGPVVVRAHQSKALPLTLRLDSATPAGRYPAELAIGEAKVPVVLHVVEVLDVRVAPRSLVVSNDPTRDQMRQVVMTNRGNVGVSFGEFGTVELRDERERGAVVFTEPLSDETVGDVVDVLVAAARREAEPAGSAEVRTSDERVSLEPGDSRVVELTIRVHEGLPDSGSFRGSLPLLDRHVGIVVVPAGSEIVPTRAQKAARGKAADEQPKETKESKKKPKRMTR